MANGLRKLIRKARRFSTPSLTNRRLSKFGQRLRVEELEERIAPAALAAGEFAPYDTATGVGVIYNSGSVSVDVTFGDGGGANTLDTMNITCDTAGAAAVIITDAASATGGAGSALIDDSANVSVTLTTGAAVADIGTHWGEADGHLDGAAPADNASVSATGGDVTGDIILNNGSSSITAISVSDGGTGTGAFNGGITTDGDLGTVAIAGAVSDSATGGWSIGDQLTGAWTLGSTVSADVDVTAANGFAAAADITIASTASGDFIATAGGILGDINVTSGGLAGAVTATAGGIAGNITVTAGGISGAITATAGGISGNITATAGGISGAIVVTAGGLSGNVTATAGGITAPITVTAGGLSGDILATAGGISAAADITITAGGITATGSITTSAGDIDGDVIVTDGGVASGATITAAANFDGVFTVSDDGMAGTLTATAGNITGAISITDGLSGDIVATAGDVDSTVTIVSGGITSTGSIVAGTDIDGAITVTAGGMAGAITAATNVDGAITVTAGGLDGSIAATAGNVAGAVTVTAGGMGATASITAGADIDGAITITDGGVTAGAVITAATNIDGNIIVSDDGMAGTITATAGTFNSATVTIVDGLSGTIAATAGAIDVDTAFDITDATNGTLSGTISAGTSITGAATITIAAGITATGSITATTDVDSAITVTAGGIASGGTITGGVNVDGLVTITAGGLAGAITASTGNIGGGVTVTAGGIAATGVISAGTDIDGAITVTDGGILSGAAITAATNIDGAITVGDDGVAGDITATAGNITGAVAITDGLSGVLKATAGSITGGVTISDATNGTLTGTIQAGTNIATGAVTIAAGIPAAGTITAGADIDSAVTVTAGGMAGTIVADTNIDGLVTITAGGLTGSVTATAGNIAGGITVTAGGISAAATIVAGADVDGAITATTGDIAAAITAATNIDGSIVATAGAITGVITATAGNLTSANITAGVGDIASIVVGGAISDAANNVTIQAEDDITSIAVTGNIGTDGGGFSVNIYADSDNDNAGNIGTITSGGEITVAENAGNGITGWNIGTIRTGGLTGDDINGLINAENDLTGLIDAGDGVINATVTIGDAQGSSPLVTFISGGISYAVWAFNTGTTTVNTDITAQVVFDGDAVPPSLDITELENAGATTPDIYITTRTDTGAEQVFTDPDIDIDNANLDVTVGADSTITVGTLYVEGNYAIGADPDVVATTTVVEGGVSGTVSAAVGEDISFGSITGDLTINVAGAGVAGTLYVLGNSSGDAITGAHAVTVNGSLGGVVFGDASQNKHGDMSTGSSITATGASGVGDIVISSDMDGSVTAQVIGNILVLGNLGSTNLATNMTITATTGNIGNIEVSGAIGADAAQSVTIQSQNGSIGLVTSGGALGAGNGTTSIVADDNITGVQSDVTVGDTATAVTVTATNGTIGTVLANGDDGAGIGINANITAGSNITAVTAVDPDEDDGGIAGAILSHNGNIGSVSTIAQNISATVTATLGNIDSVVVNPESGDADGLADDGTVSGAITAGGDIDTVSGQDVTATIISKAATATSPVLTVTDGGVDYVLNATAGPLYNITYIGTTQTIDITVDNWDGAAAYASTVDVALNTTTSVANTLNAAAFDLSLLNFDADSQTNSTNDLGTVTVEGDVSLIETGTLTHLFVEGDVLQPAVVTDSSAASPVRAVSVGSAMMVDSPTAAQLQALFEDPGVGESVVFDAPADGTLTVSAGSASTGNDVSFAIGNAGGTLNTPLVLGDGGSAEEFVVTIASGAVTQVQSTPDNDGSLTIDGDLDYAITAIDFGDITITGNLTATGSITANQIEDIMIGTAAGVIGTYADTAAAQAFLDGTGDLAGTITVTNVVADAALNGAIQSLTVLGDFTGTVVTSGPAANIGAVAIGQSIVGIDGFTKVAQSGAASGTLTVGGSLASFTSEMGFSGAVVVSGGTAAAPIAAAMGGSFTVTTGDLSGTLTTTGGIGGSVLVNDGDLSGTVTVNANTAGSGITGSVTVTDGDLDGTDGNLSGTLDIDGTVGGTINTVNGDITGNIGVSGSVTGGVTAALGDVGGSGLIMIAGDTPSITAPQGNVTADIFVGGTNGTQDLAITGLTITGDIAAGAVGGIDTLTLTLKDNAPDTNNVVYTITNTVNAGMLVEIAAGGVTTTGLDVDTITLFEDSASLSATAASADGADVDIDNIYIIENGAAALALSVEGTVDQIVAADGNALVSTSSEIQTAFNTDNSTTFSVVNAPTVLDQAIADDNDVALTLTVNTPTRSITGGVIATGALGVTATSGLMDTMGYMVSLNSSVAATVSANSSIGDIAASTNVSGTLTTEGVVAVGDGADMQADVAMYGLSGLPSWFAGGVLSEIGTVNLTVTADGSQSLIAGIAIGQDYAMGTIYAMVGDVDGTYDLGASFGGIVAPLDTSLNPTVNVPLSSQIDLMIAPYASDASGSHPDAQLELTNNEVLVTANNPYNSGNDSVTAVGSGTLAYVDGMDVYVINGLNDSAAAVNIAGNVDDLVVMTDWAGVITVDGNADGDTGQINSLTIDGDVDATTADLVAFNFESLTHNGDVTGTSPVDALQFVTNGALDSGAQSISWTNLAGDAQTLYVNSSRALEVEYNTFFGKLTSVEITGKGKASIVSVNDTLDADVSSDLRTLKSIAKQAGSSSLDVAGSDGTAHVGSITSNYAWGKVSLKGVVVDGYNETLNVDGKIKGLRITGDADDIDVSRSISKAFIGVHSNVSCIKTDMMKDVTIFGDVDEFDAIKAKKVYIAGDVTDRMSGQSWSQVAVDGTVDELWMFAGTSRGKLSKCRFGHVNEENIDNRKYVETAESITDVGGGGAVGDGVLRNLNPYYNPVKVVRTIAPGLNAYSSLEHPDYDSDAYDLTPNSD